MEHKKNFYNFRINESSEESKIGNFIYNKQWWKPKFLESKSINNFVLATDLGFDMYFDSDILSESENISTMHIKPSKDLNLKSIESIDYMPPKSCALNETLMPSWMKTLCAGKVSIKEASKNNRVMTIEVSAEGSGNKFIAIRESADSDFWSIHKEAKHKFDKCMECSKPPTHEVLWAEGHGHAWFCESHLKQFNKENKGEIISVKEVKEGKASNLFKENTNPNISDKLLDT